LVEIELYDTSLLKTRTSCTTFYHHNTTHSFSANYPIFKLVNDLYKLFLDSSPQTVSDYWGSYTHLFDPKNDTMTKACRVFKMPSLLWQDYFNAGIHIRLAAHSRLDFLKEDTYLKQTMRILIIEDEKDLGILIRNFLIKQLKIKAPESSVKIATTLKEGLIFVNDMNPDWVFVDNNLPDGKGINEIEWIKNHTAISKTCIVMMSAMNNLRDEALRKGADYFLDKPISFVEIDRILKEQRSN
jgi:two-component system KDP operon response regulator KdpE